MALPEVGLKAVIDNLSGFQAGASSITAAYSKLDKGASSVAASSVQLGNSLLSIGAIAGGAALAGVTALAAGIATFAVSGITQAISLDQQMANIAATMGKTKEAVAPLKDLILDLSLDPNLTVNATQAAEAVELLGQNGLTMSQILDGAARSTVAMANATGADFGTAANIATGAMQAFNLEAEDLTLVADGITGVLVKSKFTAEDYAGALAQAGAIAGSTGVSLQDFNTVIGATASSFASGSDAGTSFKTFLQRMANPTDEAKALMQQLGISIFDSSGNMKDMSVIVGQLNKSFGGMTEEQKASTAAVIGGADASRTLLALAGMTSEEFSTLSGQINASGQASQAAATRVDSLSGAWEILNGIIQGIQIQVGDLFLPILRQVTDVLSEMASANAPMIVGFFDALIGKGQELFAAFSKFGAGGLFAALGFEGAALFFKKLGELFLLIIGDTGTLATTLQATLGNAFTFLAANVFPILTEAIKFIIANFNEFKGAIIGIGIVMGGAIFAALVAALFSLLTPINLIIAGAALLGAAWAGNWGGIQEKTFAVWAVIQPVFQQLISWLSGAIPVAVQFLSNLWTTVLLPALIAVGNFLVTTWLPAWANVMMWLGTNIPAAIQVLSGFWTGTLLPAVSAVWGFISTTLFPMWVQLQQILIGMIGPALQNIADQWNFILLPAVTAVWAFFTGSIMPLWTAFVTFLGAVAGKALEAWAGLWQNVLLPAVTSVWDFFNTSVMPLWTAFVELVSGKVTTAINTITGLFGGLGTSVDTGASTPISNLTGTILPGLISGFEKIKELLSGLTSKFGEWTNTVSSFQLPAILTPGSPTPLEMALQGIASVLSGPLQNAFGVFGRVAQAPLKIVASLSGQIVANFRELVSLIAIIVETWQPTTEAMIAQFKNLSTASATATASIKTSFSSVAPALSSANSVASTLAVSIRSVGSSAGSATASLISMANINFNNLAEGINNVRSKAQSAQAAFSSAKSAASAFNSTSLSAMSSALSTINNTLNSIIENFNAAADAAGNSGLGSAATVGGGLVSGPTRGSGSTTIINNFSNNFGGNNISSGMDESQFDAMVLASLQRLSR